MELALVAAEEMRQEGMRGETETGEGAGGDGAAGGAPGDGAEERIGRVHQRPQPRARALADERAIERTEGRAERGQRRFLLTVVTSITPASCPGPKFCTARFWSR